MIWLAWRVVCALKSAELATSPVKRLFAKTLAALLFGLFGFSGLATGSEQAVQSAGHWRELVGGPLQIIQICGYLLGSVFVAYTCRYLIRTADAPIDGRHPSQALIPSGLIVAFLFLPALVIGLSDLPIVIYQNAHHLEKSWPAHNFAFGLNGIIFGVVFLVLAFRAIRLLRTPPDEPAHSDPSERHTVSPAIQ